MPKRLVPVSRYESSAGRSFYILDDLGNGVFPRVIYVWSFILFACESTLPRSRSISRSFNAEKASVVSIYFFPLHEELLCAGVQRHSSDLSCSGVIELPRSDP